MKNVAQRFRKPHGEGVERDNRRPPVACHECGSPTYFDPEHDASPEKSLCNACGELQAEDEQRERDEEASLEADFRHYMYSDNDLDGVQWSP